MRLHSASVDELTGALARHRRQLRIAAIASAVLAASAAAGLTATGLGVAGASAWQVRLAAVMAFAATGAVMSVFGWRRVTPARVAALIETRVAGLKNIVVTAEEVLAARYRVHPIVRDELFRAAVERLRAAAPVAVQPLSLPVGLAVGALIAAGAVVIAIPIPRSMAPAAATAASEGTDAPLAPGDLRITITPPAYTGRAPSITVNPSMVTALEGSRIRLETAPADRPPQVIEPGQVPMPFAADAGGWTHEFSATQSRVLLIHRPDVAMRGDADRLLQVRVEADRRPVVRIRTPARDLMFGEPKGQVPIEIEARDDLAVASLVLTFTRVAGSGETFTFEEGEAAVRIDPVSEGEWRGHATLRLDELKLEDGDTLVYRALATDRKPGADPSASETFVIEVGRLAGVASTGFALPEERDRQAISQQMLIIKTERLHAERDKLPRAALEEQARMLAVEQRMVKAEFVFMTGGEVADEVEEATHAHELAEGRLENTAQVELLTAIREMSRAEAQLNAADTAKALEFERAALKALQRAFDRRRYLLRALPERARIDVTRRLTGDLATARPLARSAVAAGADPTVAEARKVMNALAVAIAARDGLNAALASRVIAVDPTSDVLQKAVVALSSASDPDHRLAAARETQKHLAEFVRARLPASASGRVRHDPLLGRFADESARSVRRQGR
jgi:hypothetical protein